MRLFGKVDGQIDSRDGAAILTPPFDMSVSGGSTTPMPDNIGQTAYPTITAPGVSADRVQKESESMYRFRDVPTLRGPVTVEITSPYANSEIRYTTGGQNPTPTSKLYTEPLVFKQNSVGDHTTVKARIYDKANSNKKSKIIRLQFNIIPLR